MIKCIAIDDDQLFLRNLQMILADIEGVELIASFNNPINGIMAVVKQKPDLLLIDMEMPYLTGFEALSTLENQPKVIVISGYLQEIAKTNLQIDKYIDKGKLHSGPILEEAIREIFPT